MEEVQSNVAALPSCLVKATLQLGSEIHRVSSANEGILSEQLGTMKEQSMSILKEFITKNNAPADVPDDLVESSSGEEETEISEKPPKKRK